MGYRYCNEDLGKYPDLSGQGLRVCGSLSKTRLWCRGEGQEREVKRRHGSNRAGGLATFISLALPPFSFCYQLIASFLTHI